MSFLQTLRGKSKEEKRLFAAGVSSLILGIIFFVWISVFLSQFSGGSLSVSNTATTTLTKSEQEEKSFSSFLGGLRNQVQDVYKNIRSTEIMQVFDASVQYTNDAAVMNASNSASSRSGSSSPSMFATTTIESHASTTFDDLVKSLFESAE